MEKLIAIPYIPQSIHDTDTKKFLERPRPPWYWSADGADLYFYSGSKGVVDAIWKHQLVDGSTELFYCRDENDVLGVSGAPHFDPDTPLVIFERPTRHIAIVNRNGDRSYIFDFAEKYEKEIRAGLKRYVNFLEKLTLDSERDAIGGYQFNRQRDFLAINLSRRKYSDAKTDTGDYWWRASEAMTYFRGARMSEMVTKLARTGHWDHNNVDACFASLPDDPFIRFIEFNTFTPAGAHPTWNCDGDKLAITESALGSTVSPPQFHEATIEISEPNTFRNVIVKRNHAVEWDHFCYPDDYLADHVAGWYFESAAWSPIHTEQLTTILTTAKADTERIYLHEQQLLLLNYQEKSAEILYTVDPKQKTILWPNWSADGKLIAFTEFDDQTSRSSIVVIDIDNPSDVRCVADEIGDINAIWSPEGRQLAILSTTDKSDQRIDILDYSTGERRAGTLLLKSNDVP